MTPTYLFSFILWYTSLHFQINFSLSPKMTKSFLFLSNIRKALGNLQQFSMLALLLENPQQFNKHPVTVAVNTHPISLHSCLPAVTPEKQAIRAPHHLPSLGDPHSILSSLQGEDEPQKATHPHSLPATPSSPGHWGTRSTQMSGASPFVPQFGLIQLLGAICSLSGLSKT